MNYTLLFLTLSSLLNSAFASWSLSSKDVTALTGDEAKLRCEITGPKNDTRKLLHSWRNTNSKEILFFEETKAQATDGMSVDFNDNEMILTINKVKLEDENTYQCELLGIKPGQYQTVKLTVHQKPQDFHIEDYSESPKSATSETVAKCFARGAKPVPAIWFTNELGEKVEVSEDVEIDNYENGLVDVALALNTVFHKEDNGMKYKCNVQLPGREPESKLTEPVNVLYEASAHLVGVKQGGRKILQEGENFEATCLVDGNPKPSIKWLFVPDTNKTADDHGLPDNFVVSEDRSTIKTDAVTTLTNNGTFNCEVSNALGPTVSVSFRLGVFALPVTTVPTTTASTNFIQAQPPEGSPAMEPRSAGSDAAVIGGVVAVAAFVLIIAIILIVKYFMSHKGTYHTHETKTPEHGHEKAEDNEPMFDEDEENELGQKKRTEYFM